MEKRYHLRGGRPHREAFPSIDVQALLRADKAGLRRWEWRNENQTVVGHGELIVLTADKATIRFEFPGSVNIKAASGEIAIVIDKQRINPDVERKFFICPTCSQQRKNLYLVAGHWGCADCLQLSNLTKRLGKVNRAVYDRDRLRSVLASANDAERRTRWHLNQNRKLDRLDRELERDGVMELPQELRHHTSVKWLDTGADFTPFEQPESRWTPDSGIGVQQPDTGAAVPPPEPTPTCSMIGAPFFYRRIERSLSEHREERSRQVLESWQQRGSGDRSELAANLLRAISLEPVSVDPGWSEQSEGLSDEGLAELSFVTGYRGDAFILGLNPYDIKPDPPIKLIILDDAIKFRVRSCSGNRLEMEVAMSMERKRFDAALEAVNTLMHDYNNECDNFSKYVAEKHTVVRTATDVGPSLLVCHAGSFIK